MRNPIFPAAALLAAALSSIAAPPAMAATHSVSPAMFVLKRSDVPSTFNAKTDFVRPISVADALARYSVKAVTLTKKGRVGGYESVFARPYTGKSTAHGFYGVADDVTQFTSTSGSHWFFARMKKAAYGNSSVSVPSIGDEIVAADSKEVRGQRVAQITFRHGMFVVNITTSYIGSGDPLPKAVHYARVINHRLTAHGQ